MELKSASQLRYANAEGTSIDMSAIFEEHDGTTLPFTASASDIEPHGRGIFERAKIGEFGPIAPYVAPAPLLPTQQQISATASKVVDKLSVGALPDLMEVIEKLVTGADKELVKSWNDKVKAEKVKIT